MLPLSFTLGIYFFALALAAAVATDQETFVLTTADLLWSAHKGISSGGNSNAEKRAKAKNYNNNNNDSTKQQNSNNSSKKVIANGKFAHPQKMHATRALHISALRLRVVFLWCLRCNAQLVFAARRRARSSLRISCYCCRHYYLLPPLRAKQNSTNTQLERSKPCDIIAVCAT